jgi:DNA-binding CsgD family transcriptional regulator
MRRLESGRRPSYLLRAVAALAARDARQVLQFLADAEEIEGDEPFTPEVLGELRKLIPADWVGYEERDLFRKQCMCEEAEPNFDEVYGCIEYDARVARDEDPLGQYHSEGHFDAMSLSRLLPRRALSRTRYHRLVLEPLGITDILSIAIPAPQWHPRHFLFDRLEGEFSVRDTVLLNVLQPHFGCLWRAARTRRRLRQLMVGLEWSTEQGRRGVVLLGPHGRIDFVSPAARRLLRDYFGPTGASLPPQVADWLGSGSRPLSRRGERRSLTIDRAGDALLLQEARDGLGLTAREREILASVSQGKTNSEIAECLWISPNTVRKHLENIYAKLGVRTRTGAVARFLGALNDEA